MPWWWCCSQLPIPEMICANKQMPSLWSCSNQICVPIQSFQERDMRFNNKPPSTWTVWWSRKRWVLGSGYLPTSYPCGSLSWTRCWHTMISDDFFRGEGTPRVQLPNCGSRKKWGLEDLGFRQDQVQEGFLRMSTMLCPLSQVHFAQLKQDAAV